MKKKMFILLGSLAGCYALLCLAAYLFQEKLIFHPLSLPPDYPFRFHEPFEEINLQSAPGVKLNALLFRANSFHSRSAKGIILYFHGNAGNLARWGTVASDFTVNGYDVLIVDYRTYGKSRGPLSEKALHQDARYVYDYVLKQYAEERVIVYGRSVGSGIATRLASETHPKRLILETPFYNFPDLTRHFFPFLPHLLLRYTFRTDQWIKQVRCPVHIFHGTADGVVPYACSTKLVELLNRGKKSYSFSEDLLTTIEGGGHNNLNTFRQYHAQLQRILQDRATQPDREPGTGK